MLRQILLAFLLIGTACAMHLEYLKVDSDEEQLDDESLAVDQAEDLPMPRAMLPGKCWACKWAVKKVKKHLGDNAKAEEIKQKLLKVCDAIGLLKNLCKKMIEKSLGVLIEELSTSDDPATVCANIGACKSKPMLKLIQAFPEVLEKL
ncbi:antimicrobial peptide NK-lysin-like [Colossoma macropomum]|uniref:antimicrobial peptide NK-lysin-like n=1 Tax=Colossoma macropomum TaxID=42526 RepID=UPI001864D7E3|nr:antimicrobial peptide NK-lysin-like [Colossoma macropomum]